MPRIEHTYRKEYYSNGAQLVIEIACELNKIGTPVKYVRPRYNAIYWKIGKKPVYRVSISAKRFPFHDMLFSDNSILLNIFDRHIPKKPGCVELNPMLTFPKELTDLIDKFNFRYQYSTDFDKEKDRDPEVVWGFQSF